MKRTEAKHELCAFLDTIAASDTPTIQADEDVLFDDSGLIDSLAMLQIVTFLEDRFGLDFTEVGIDTERFGSIGRILDLIEASAD